MCANSLAEGGSERGRGQMNLRKLAIGALAAALLVAGAPPASARSNLGSPSETATWYVYDNGDSTFTVTKQSLSRPSLGTCYKPTDPNQCSGGSAGAYYRTDKYHPWIVDNR